jgi:hypothetical protein
MTRKKLLMVSLFTLLLTWSWADAVRTVVADTVTLDPSQPEGQIVSLRYNEAVGVLVPEEALFMEGVELELRIPRELQGSESSIAWSLYTGIMPAPGAGYDYSGELLSNQILPSRVSMTLRIPMVSTHSMRSSPFYSLLPAIVGPKRYPLMFKLSPVGKGLSPAMEAAVFKLVIRPVLSDEGGIRLVYEGAQEDLDYVLFLDDKKLDASAPLIVAKKGLRTLRVSAAGYKEEVLSIAVEAGKISRVALSLVPDAPRLVIYAPQGASISLNGKALPAAEWAGINLEPGDYTVVCKIGDYSVSRKFSALRGKVYTVELSVELDIQTAP